MPRQHRLFPLLILILLAAGGCAGRRQPVLPDPTRSDDGVAESRAVVEPGPATESEPDADPAAAGQAEESSVAAVEAGAAPASESGERQPLRSLCRQAQETEGPESLVATRRRLAETVCVATLWLDGLMGGEPDVANARSVSGRLEVSSLYSEAEGFDPKVRFTVRYDLPTLERRLSLFLGRQDREETVRDREEPFAIRSTIFGVENEEQWLAGLGYRPPGKWSQRIDFKVGGRLRSAPEVYAQGRWRRQVFVGEDVVWRFRETVFWENRVGFGLTSRADVDRVLRPDLLLRWANVGTVSESSDGLDWRSSLLLYHNLIGAQAIAQETFIRGGTRREVPIREYGFRGTYRRPLYQRWLFGELILGYTWPQESAAEPRRGSTIVGVAVDLHFGRDPY